MAGRLYDETTGTTYILGEDGKLIPADRPGLIGQAGRQMHDIWGGAQGAYANMVDDPALAAQVEAETAARNETFRGADELYPWESMIGQALPGMALTGRMGFAAPLPSILLNAGLGAVETALDVGEGGSWVDRAQAGALGGVLGDMGARIAGRVLSSASAIGDAMSGRRLQANPEAEAWEALGGEAMAYQRMNPDTMGQSFAESATKGSQASLWGAPQVKQAFNANEALMNNAAAEAVGTPLHTNGLMDRAWRKTALDRFEMGFAEIEGIAQGKDIQLAGPLRQTLNDMTPIDKLKKFGLFKGLDKKGQLSANMSGREWNIARQALADEAAEESNSEVAKRLYGLIDELDTSMERALGEVGPEFTESFSKLREQYRVFMQLEKPGVINDSGNISIPRLGDALDNKSTGFGRTATAGTREVFPETQRLLDLAEAGDKPVFKAFKSSGTAENLALRNAASDVQSAVTDGGVGGFMGLMASQAAPLITPVMEAGGGLPYDALINRAAPAMFPKAGGAVGRSALDEMFYPFVGHEDDTQP